MLTSEVVGIGIDTPPLVDVGMVAGTVPVLIASDFVASVACAADALARMDSLTAVFSDAVTIVTTSSIGAAILADVDAAVLAALKLVDLPSPLAAPVPFGRAAPICWAITGLECTRALQALIPSYQVRSRCAALPAPPQFLNHDPPRPQQLLRPDLPMIPHLEHTGLTIVVAAAVVYMRGIVSQEHTE